MFFRAAPYLFALAIAGLPAVPAPVRAVEPPLRAEGAWVRAAPPGMPMLAGYVRLTNAGDRPLRLVAVFGERFAAVELHRSETVDGVSRMRPVPELEIAPGETVTLEPGGLHLMLMHPDPALREGNRVVLEFEFAGGVRLPVEFVVGRAAPLD